MHPVARQCETIDGRHLDTVAQTARQLFRHLQFNRHSGPDQRFPFDHSYRGKRPRASQTIRQFFGLIRGKHGALLVADDPRDGVGADIFVARHGQGTK